MKGPAVLLLLLMPCLVFAQGVFTNQTNEALGKVINDYPNKFRNIKGDLLSEGPQSTDYASKVQIPGASEAIVTKYSSEEDHEVFSWKCTLTESDEFEVVSKKYKSLYQQIKNTIVKVEGEKPYILNGAYEVPTEEKRFVASSFTLLPPSGALGKLKIELAMEFYVTEWRITLFVYDKEEEAVVME